jgi:hypothetical protein
MPVAFSSVKAYGRRRYGLVLEPCKKPDHYRRQGQLEVPNLKDTTDVTETLNNANEGKGPYMVHPDVPGFT